MKRFLCITIMLTILAMQTVNAASDTVCIYPTSVLLDNDGTTIRKVYELLPDETPNIPQEDFKQGGITYSFLEVLREEIRTTEHKAITEDVTVNSPNNSMEKVLSLLPQTKEVKTEDGFIGVLTLDIATIKTVVAGYGNSKYEKSATRSYPNLANQDMQYIPKSITDNGVTLSLANVEWQTDNRMNVDDYEIGNRYTAVAIYTGTGSRSYVKGYTVTAQYSGEISRTVTDKIQYTAIFTQVKESINWYKISIVFSMIALLLIIITKILFNPRKGKKKNEKIVDDFDDWNDV